MCSTLSMPADYEMLVSHSPPVFSHSPPSMSFLTDYNPYHRFHLPKTAPWRPPMPSRYERCAASAAHIPRRPCLVLRTEDALSEECEGPLSPTRLKKRVVFADDKGMSLTQVRVMSEPSSVPPLWSNKFLAQVTKGLTAEVSPEPWEVLFPQPAANYVDFRRRLDEDKVSLENVIVRETEECVVGTIKVRNLEFHKEVVVRSSSNDWATHEDTFCKYVTNHLATPSAAQYALYDTFSFRLTLPPRSRRIEFCVCFRCEDNEYWDNNSGKNYVLVKKQEVAKPYPPEEIRTAPATTELLKCSDAVHAKVEAWGEFASWNHLQNDGPYW